MTAAALPANEEDRLKALRGYAILDTSPEREFDDITLLASQICGAPIAMISLIDEERQWFKSKIGTSDSETARDIAFCAHGILQADFFIVRDAAADDRFASSPLVTGESRIRFYAGSPLVTPEGYSLGMLCVNDQVPRDLAPEQKSALQALSRQVVALLELRRTGVQLRETVTQLKDAQEELKRDAESRQRAVDALRESEEKFHQLADNILDVFWITSPNLDTIHYVSPGYELVWGRSMQGLYLDPHQWVEAILPEDREQAFAAFAVLKDRDSTASVEYRITRPDGTIRWIHDRGYQVRDASGKLIRLTGIASDITERKNAEVERDRLAAILESTTDMVSVADPAGRLLYLNRAGRALLGFGPREDITKAVIADFHSHPSRHPVITEGLPAAVRQGAWSGEVTILSRSGRQIPVSQVILSHKAPGGRIEFFSTIVRDITDRKRLEAKLFQSQKMETVGKLAGGVAHEFNSILTAIIGQSELLLDRIPEGSPLCENAKEIIQAADRAATLTRQLLAYGRKQILQPEAFDLDRIIANMEGLFRNFMGRDVEVQFVPAPGLKAVKADAGQIEQVITNLAMNARDAMPNGGKLTVETANVSVDEASAEQFLELKPGNYVMLSITDTGIGMTPEVKSRAFEPFFSTKDVGQGAGLGLSTSYGIVKQSGGHISLYSEPGRGTTVRIFLPQLNQPAPSHQQPSSSDLPRGTETVLIVEDDPALRSMAQTLLKRLGYTVHAAADGVEALSLKQQTNVGHIDLLFTDVVMPHMSGKELADRMRSLSPHTKILFTSAFAENAIVHQGVLDEGVALLQKPFKAGALAHKLREVLDNTVPHHAPDTHH